ncbi:type II toxin-antitoxin system RelE/ParE family toxin [Luteibacter sp. 3190]|jgi:toxin HigB-1|uniref:type II toxin-antitoxin system RelE/ParE family toxin n=1 Tax=Luteibacter sp. 3190 TaxID=2817736 RepID=UPI00285F1394|nr:type II toxin-antitoxin system RelE/ParE family toxin [Luteibacter sp. 3190]MDR6934808.1 proteic killer suppression protein [Luteibacter sp. 3190]
MIVSFGDEETRDVWLGRYSRRWSNIRSSAIRRLAMLNRAATLDDLRLPPSNHLKPLRGDRSGQYSVRINDQYRICFLWADGHAHDVRIVDYH